MTDTVERIPWWQSMGQWGNLIVALSMVYNMIGTPLGWPTVAVDPESLGAFLTELGAVIGLMMSIVGRARATQPISLRRVLPGITLKS